MVRRPPPTVTEFEEMSASRGEASGHHRWRMELEDLDDPAEMWISGGRCAECEVGFHDRTDPYWQDTPCPGHREWQVASGSRY